MSELAMSCMRLSCQGEEAPQSSCGRPRTPGRGQTGCAFRGAKMALQPIADAAHLVHGPSSCETGSWIFRPTLSSGSRLHRRSFTTAFTEADVIQGGEAKLLRAIGEVIEKHDPPAVFVYQTCLPAMIGDDIAAVCRKAEERWGRRVIAVDAPGFTGSRPYGNHRAAQALMDHVVGTREPTRRTATDINIIGEFNLAGELDRLRPLLAALGIRVLASISGDGRFDDIATAHQARAAVLICSQGMSHLAEMMRDDLGIPFIEGSFYGVANTSETLRNLANLLTELGAPGDLPERTEALIAREEARIADALSAFRRRLAGKRALLLCGGVKAWSLGAILKDAGMEIAGTSVGKASPRDRWQVADKIGVGTPMLDGWESEAMDARLRAGEVDIVLGGGSNQYLCLKAGVPWLEVNHERSIAMTGYDGTLALLEGIDRELSSPIWSQLSQPAPWDDMPEYPLPLVGRVGVGARVGATNESTPGATQLFPRCRAQAPHPNPPHQGEGAKYH